MGKKIKLDIDYKDVPCVQIANRLYMASERLDFKIHGVEILESNKGFHITFLIFGNISDSELCFLQLLLCSDWKREILNLERSRNGTPMGSPGGNIFFSKKIKSTVNLKTGEVTDSRVSSVEKRTAYCKLYERLILDALSSFGRPNNSDKTCQK